MSAAEDIPALELFPEGQSFFLPFSDSITINKRGKQISMTVNCCPSLTRAFDGISTRYDR
jgi:hypothetical protein